MICSNRAAAFWLFPSSVLTDCAPPSCTTTESACGLASHTHSCKGPCRFPSTPRRAPSSTRFAASGQILASVPHPCSPDCAASHIWSRSDVHLLPPSAPCVPHDALDPPHRPDVGQCEIC